MKSSKLVVYVLVALCFCFPSVSMAGDPFAAQTHGAGSANIERGGSGVAGASGRRLDENGEVQDEHVDKPRTTYSHHLNPVTTTRTFAHSRVNKELTLGSIYAEPTLAFSAYFLTDPSLAQGVGMNMAISSALANTTTNSENLRVSKLENDPMHEQKEDQFNGCVHRIMANHQSTLVEAVQECNGGTVHTAPSGVHGYNNAGNVGFDAGDDSNSPENGATTSVVERVFHTISDTNLRNKMVDTVKTRYGDITIDFTKISTLFFNEGGLRSEIFTYNAPPLPQEEAERRSIRDSFNVLGLLLYNRCRHGIKLRDEVRNGSYHTLQHYSAGGELDFWYEHSSWIDEDALDGVWGDTLYDSTDHIRPFNPFEAKKHLSSKSGVIEFSPGLFEQFYLIFDAQRMAEGKDKGSSNPGTAGCDILKINMDSFLTSDGAPTDEATGLQGIMYWYANAVGRAKIFDHMKLVYDEANAANVHDGRGEMVRWLSSVIARYFNAGSPEALGAEVDRRIGAIRGLMPLILEDLRKKAIEAMESGAAGLQFEPPSAG